MRRSSRRIFRLSTAIAAFALMTFASPDSALRAAMSPSSATEPRTEEAPKTIAIDESIRASLRDLPAELGPPIEDAHVAPFGTYQRFAHGCVHPDGAGHHHIVKSCDPPPDMKPVLEKIAKAIPKHSSGSDATLGVTWLPTGQRWSHRGDEPRAAASASKWVWAAAALMRSSIEEVEPLAVPAFHHSDNVAAGKLIDLAGGPDAVNDFTERLGIASTDMQLCAFNAGIARKASRCDARVKFDNAASAEGGLAFLERVWRGDFLSQAAHERLLEWATLAPPGHFSLGRQLPPDVAKGIHQKRGELPPGCCLVDESWTTALAIVRTSRGHYATSLSLAHGEVYPNQIVMIEWASCVIYHAFERDHDDPFAAGCKLPADVNHASP